MRSIKYAAFLILLFAAIPTRATVSVVQTCKNNVFSTSLTITAGSGGNCSSNFTLHSDLAIFCYVNLSSGAANLAATDTLTNSFVNISASVPPQQGALIVKDSLAGADTITITAPGTNLLSCILYEVSGLGNNPTIGVSASGGTTTSGTMTLTGGSASIGDFVFVGGWTDGSVAMTAGAGYTLPASATQCGSFGFCSAAEYVVAVSGGTVTAGFTIGGSTDWQMAIYIMTPGSTTPTGRKRRAKSLF
jgi:hypothetical protein